MDELLYEDLETLPDFSTRFPGDDYYNYSAFTGEDGTFYFVPFPGNNPTMPPATYSHLDPIMRFFIYLCHVNGLFTTAGWRGVKDAQDYFDHLKSQEQEAQRSGLKLTNFMTGEEIVFKDKDYRVPWGSAQELADLGDEIRYDRIGLLVPENSKEIIENLKNNPYSTGLSSIEHKRVLDIDGSRFEHFAISVRHEEKEVRKEEWAKLSAHIMSSLGKKMKLYEGDSGRKSKHRQL